MGNYRGERVSESANTISSLRGSPDAVVPELRMCEWCGGSHPDGEGCSHALVVFGSGKPGEIKNGDEFKKALTAVCTWQRQEVERRIREEECAEERSRFLEQHPPLKLGKMRCKHCDGEMEVEVHLA